MAHKVDRWEANDGTIWNSEEEAQQHERKTNTEANFLFENYEDEDYCEQCGGVTFDMCVVFVNILKQRFKFVDKNKKSK